MRFLTLLFGFLAFVGCSDSGDSPEISFDVKSIVAGGTIALERDVVVSDIPLDASIVISFSQPVQDDVIDLGMKLSKSGVDIGVEVVEQANGSYELQPSELLKANSNYVLKLTSDLKSVDGIPFEAVNFPFKTVAKSMVLQSVTYNGREAIELEAVEGVSLDLDISLTFSDPVDLTSLQSAINIGGGYDLSIAEISESSYSVSPIQDLPELSRFVLFISDNLIGANGESFAGYAQEFHTELDSSLKFQEITDDDLLTKIQEQTFKYFWDYGHPTSGLARERLNSGETITIGGSGFGLMTILVGIERGFISRQEGIDRLETIITFLDEKADKFHGAWSHWLNGSTGEVIPFSTNDNGGDLVETAFMVQGLLTVRQYLDANTAQEAALIDTINRLWEGVEWDWYTQDNQSVLYWHWSPDKDWVMNHKITGWNEAMIVYALAAASPTHTIQPEVYTQGWGRNGAIVNNGNSYYNYQLDLRDDMGGPLFFAHYSFLGMDPRNLSDQYANYWDQNVNHSLINWAYCVDNPKDYLGYSAHCWGLTASDNHQGYSAHSPDNDLGVITPTAAISSLPYAPEQSMDAIRFFYYILGDDLWGEYGFYDAFNLTEDWVASSYLAIDQGPIIIMIENYRTGLLWNLFMSAPEIQNGLKKLDINYE